MIEPEENDIEKSPEAKLWRIVRYCHSKNSKIEGCKLMPNDLIKLGRVRFKVREVMSPPYERMAKRIEKKKARFQHVNKKNKSLEQTQEVKTEAFCKD